MVKKESSFQYDVVRCAKLNGWRIDVADLHPKYRDERFYRHVHTRFLGKVKKVLDFLFGRRDNIFTFAYHTHDSRNSQKGYPDLTLVHPRRQRVIWAELKRDGEYPTLEQRLWLAALSCVEDAAPHAVLVRLWRPKDMDAIVEELGGRDHRLFV